MAKGRNQERSRKKAGGAGEQGQSRAESGSADGPSRPASGGASPADVARKHQRRFGHN